MDLAHLDVSAILALIVRDRLRRSSPPPGTATIESTLARSTAASYGREELLDLGRGLTADHFAVLVPFFAGAEGFDYDETAYAVVARSASMSAVARHVGLPVAKVRTLLGEARKIVELNRARHVAAERDEQRLEELRAAQARAQRLAARRR